MALLYEHPAALLLWSIGIGIAIGGLSVLWRKDVD